MGIVVESSISTDSSKWFLRDIQRFLRNKSTMQSVHIQAYRDEKLRYRSFTVLVLSLK